MGKLNDMTVRGWIRLGDRFEGRSDGDGLVRAKPRRSFAPRWLSDPT